VWYDDEVHKVWMFGFCFAKRKGRKAGSFSRGVQRTFTVRARTFTALIGELHLLQQCINMIQDALLAVFNTLNPYLDLIEKKQHKIKKNNTCF
jgi:hypothetical protein